MKLTFLGNQYEVGSMNVSTLETGTKGKYRGHAVAFHFAQRFPLAEAASPLTYRGNAY